MELEIQHLAPYLPYDLYFIDKDGIRDNMKSISTEIKLINMGWGKALELNELRPILRPLSDYTGKRTGGSVSKELQCSLSVVHEIWDLADGTKHVNEITYGCIQAMNRNHIDYNLLIKSDKAIDINTLK
jgi:hypothetical protein